MNRSKKYKNVNKKIDSTEALPAEEAVEAVKNASYSSFEGTLELKVNLNVDPKDSEQNVRFITELPYPTGRKRNVLVFSSDKLKETEYNTLNVIQADENTLEKIESNKLVPRKDFDLVVAEPKEMGNIAKVAKVLGPKGLMPSPKTETVGNPKEILKNLDKGQIEVRVQPGNRVVHMVLGTVKTDTKNVVENLNSILEDIQQNKPSKVKKDLIQSVYLSATMSPSVRVEIE